MAVLGAALAACVDGPLSTGRHAGQVPLQLAPQFSYTASSALSLPIENVRTIAWVADPTVTRRDTTTTPVSPDAARFVVEAQVDLGGRDSASVYVEVQMLSYASGSEVIEWSALVGPIHVEASVTPPPFTDPVPLVRGTLANVGVESLSVAGPSFMYAGAAEPAYAFVVGAPGYQVNWTSSNTAVAEVDAVGDSVMVRGRGFGAAWIRAAAGAASDSFLVEVDTITVGDVAFVLAIPDSAVVIVGATRAWQAFAMDAQENPVAATFAWQSLEPSIASVSGSGVVTGLSVGRARIVVSASGIADTAIAVVDSLPGGVDVVWQGGVPGFEQDWFTPDNWSPARVPTPDDVVYIGNAGWAPFLTGDVTVAGLLTDTLSGWYVDMFAATLTVRGDAFGYFYGDSLSSVVVDAQSARIWGQFPTLRLLGDIDVAGYVYVEGDLDVDGSARATSLALGGNGAVYVSGDFTSTNATLAMAEDSSGYSYLDVDGSIHIDGGTSTTSLSGGSIYTRGDFIVTDAACAAFGPTGTEVDIAVTGATISMDCAGPDSNRFHDLYVYANVDAWSLQLGSDLHVNGELYLSGGNGGRVVGNGYTVFASDGSVWNTDFERAFVEVNGAQRDAVFYFDSVSFSSMTGEQRPQVVYRHPGALCDCYDWQDIAFDASSAGPYIEAIDTDQADSLVFRLYMEKNPGDGPSRTLVDGAEVYWSGVPTYFEYYGGDGQTGTQYQPLVDSLVVSVYDFGFMPVAGVQVNWAVSVGNGSVSPTSSLTDADGLARTLLTVGDTAYPTQQVIATTSFTPDTLFFYAYPTPASGQTDVPMAPARATIDAAPRPRRAPELAPPHERIERPRRSRPASGLREE